MAAGIFVAARIVHPILYIRDIATARSLAWGIGLCCVVALFVLAARA